MTELEPYQLRVVAEREDLDDKTAKLATFLASEAAVSLEPEENYLLRIQFQAMNTYAEVLGHRIDRFKRVKRSPKEQETAAYRRALIDQIARPSIQQALAGLDPTGKPVF